MSGFSGWIGRITESLGDLLFRLGNGGMDIAGGEEEMAGWIRGDLGELAHAGFTDAQPWNVYSAHMQVWQPKEIGPDCDYYRVVGFQLETSGVCEMAVSVFDEEDQPLEGVPVCQGWRDGPPLPGDAEPNGGDPRGYPLRGFAVETNAQGQSKFGWGAGEQFRPEDVEGPHWYWVAFGADGNYSDVVYGFGWRQGTNHYHARPIFQRCDSLPEPADLEDVLAELFDDVAESLQYAADRLRG